MRDLTNTPYKQFIWFIAEIVDTNTDPDKLGRVRIRILGFYSEDTPRDKLPLALVMNGGAARLVEKQWVVGFFLDGAMAQQPFVLGTVGSAIGNPAKVNSQENPGPNQNRTSANVSQPTASQPTASQPTATQPAAPQPVGVNGIYPDIFPTNGRYPFEYLGVPQSPKVPYGRDATADPQPFTNMVLHDTAGGGSGPDAVKGGQEVRADGFAYGYHFYVDRNGKVFQGAPLNVRTNGIEPASAPYTNKNTINIAFINGGKDLGDDPTTAQLKTAALLVQDVGNNFGIPKSNISTHGVVSVGRKSPTEALTAFNHAMKTYVNPSKATIPLIKPPPPIKIGTGP